MTFPALGAPAPEFSLQDQHGNTVSLAQFRGKQVLVYFYPKAMTPGCTVQACGLRDVKGELDALDTVVLALSPDSVKSLKKFAERDGLNFTLLSDADHAVAEQYGVWGMKKFMGREFMGISTMAPIFEAIEGAQTGEVIEFNGRTLTVEEVA